MSVFNPLATTEVQPLTTHLEGDVLHVYPSREASFQKIYLTASKSAWITIQWLSEELTEDASEHYQELFDLHPADRGKVIVMHQEVDSPRWHRSYLNTPVRDTKKMKTYMYSGKKLYEDLTLPTPFQPFLDYMNAEEEDKYNQVIANWYADGKDYTAAHSDCQVGMKPNAGIAILTLCEYESSPRELRFTPKNLKESQNDNLYRHVKIETSHGSIITMFGDVQKKFRHALVKNRQIRSSRLSLTFRKF